MKLVMVVLMALTLAACSMSGSHYEYREDGDGYSVTASAHIQNNSETVDLEVYVLQAGNVVKHIKFGKEGTDNTAALESRAGAIEEASSFGANVARGIFSLPWLQ